MADMDVGNQLAQLPVGSMVEGMGLAIAKAQTALDENTVASLQKLAATTLEVNGTKKSLIEFGLVPSFYHFTEATLDLKFSMSMSTEESQSLALSASGSFNKGGDKKDPKKKGSGGTGNDGTDQSETKAEAPKAKSGLAVGASLNFENTRKYGFSAEGSTEMNLKLVAVPPPAALMAAIQPAEAA